MATPRKRKNTVEVPGAAEVTTAAPITTAQINAAVDEQNQLAEFAEHERPKVEHQAIVEQSELFGQVQRHQGYSPQIGDRWSGLVLTEAGWRKPEDVDADNTAGGA